MSTEADERGKTMKSYKMTFQAGSTRSTITLRDASSAEAIARARRMGYGDKLIAVTIEGR
jgi:hypothetical protein